METPFLLRVVKEIYIDLNNIDEANQIVNLMANRESLNTVFGKMTTVFTEVEQLQCV